jgi:L-2,4-diaminobutyrate decarboxylase
MTNGGTLANLTALLAARAAKWPEGEAWQDGNQGIHPCILVNEQAHYCIDRAVRIMGWGDAGVVNIPSDEAFRMKTEVIDEAIATAISEGLTPVAIVGSACTTSTGSFDNLNAIADAAKKHNLWFHVDGAHGAAVRLSPTHRHFLDGLDRADSFIMDFHKMMMCPGLTTGVFFRDGADAYKTFHQKADYLLTFDSGEEDWSNMGRRTFECTKNMMAQRVFTLLAAYGPQVFVDYLESVHAIAAHCADAVTANPDFDLVIRPDTNIVCFRFHPKTAGLNAGDLDHINAMIRNQLREQGDFYIVQTKLRGQAWLRCTFTNPMTTNAHVDDMLTAVAEAGSKIVGLRSILG